MGDPLKFQSSFQYNVFMVAFFVMIALEAVIVIMTHQKSDHVKKQDKGTRWLLIGCYVFCIYASTFTVSHMVPNMVRNLVLSPWVAWIGIVFILLGILVRIVAVLTLKRGFTVTVQTRDTQQLVTNGIYRKIRNPAYTGSILSLIGVAVAFRSLIGIPVVLVVSILCYKVRIQIEEHVLEEKFGTPYEEYEAHTFRLIPYIW